jgi:hypothetical protein
VREQPCNSGQWKRRDEREREKMGQVSEVSEEKRVMSGAENGLGFFVFTASLFFSVRNRCYQKYFKTIEL